jgi:hypothetical protein
MAGRASTVTTRWFKIEKIKNMPWGRRLASSVACFALAAIGAHAETEYAGAKSCAACHPAEFRRQSSSEHATALFRTPEHPLAGAFSDAGTLTRKPNYRFQFFLSGSTLQTRIRDAADVMELPMTWAFGAGAQAVTFVSKVDKDWYVEHYSTYYSALHAWGPTPGQADVRATTLPEAAGILYKTLDPNTGIAGCFECHSTGPVSFGPTGEAKVSELSVRCEACHGAGALHVRSPSRKNIQNPARLTAAQLNEFCGRCHRPPAGQGVKIDWNYSWNVRHQPVYLSQSACFRKSRGALSCLTCHDPHEPSARKPAADYNAHCVDCHSAASRPPKPICIGSKPSNCIDCHMPLVSPQSPLRFTNHWIGKYGEGAKLRPAGY